MTIHVTLRPELEALVDTLVASGKYKSAEDVVAAAIEELALQEAEAAGLPVARTDDDLRRLIAEADAEDVYYDSKVVFAELRALIKKA